ncbi:MAG TPA: HAMP domain-containing sensor histidine kinase [Spirochaetia bacterium]|nr:HAMP domain-containing sensor histidine kinase [Spirochaetia bacterium]
MERVERYLRGLLLGTAVVLALLRAELDAHVLVLIVLMVAYSGTMELVWLLQKHFSAGTAFASAACELLFASWMYYLFRVSLLLVFDLLILLRAHRQLKGGRFIVVAIMAAVLYFAAVAVTGFQKTRSDGVYFLVAQFLLYPGVALGAFLLISQGLKRSQQDVERERDELARRLDARNDTLATMSHEFRTPLTMIHSSSQILLEERPGALNDTQRRFVNTIAESTSRLIRLADDLLARIKVDSTWLALDLAEVDVRPLIKKSVQAMTPFAEERSRNLRYVYPHMLSMVLADPKWIHQVLVNLIHNAIKYTEGVGSIVLSVKENEEWVVVTVSDDGGGILNIRKTEVFQKYYQENQESDGSLDGAGLGLAIVKNIVEKHNGSVYVGSVPGMGSIFSFTLPIARKNPS